jgi:hypothetical protein
MLIQGHRGLLAPGAVIAARLPGGGRALARGHADSDGGFVLDVSGDAVEALELTSCAGAGGGPSREQTIARIRLPHALAGLVAVVEVARARHCDRHGAGRVQAVRAEDGAGRSRASGTAYVAPRIRLVFADGSVAPVEARAGAPGRVAVDIGIAGDYDPEPWAGSPAS